jgi:peroxin-10
MQLRSVLILSSTIPPFLISRLTPRLTGMFPNSRVAAILRHLPQTLDIISEINLAIFYFSGTYYDLAKRIFRIRHVIPRPLHIYRRKTD